MLLGDININTSIAVTIVQRILCIACGCQIRCRGYVVHSEVAGNMRKLITYIFNYYIIISIYIYIYVCVVKQEETHLILTNADAGLVIIL